MKINTQQLILEVTRRCNMACEHCMRGDAQDMDMDIGLIDKALSSVSDIGCMTFSGGEPTLNVPAIRYTLQYCKEHEISVNSFYIVTNGKAISEDFLICVLEWYCYCMDCYGEPDICGVALSQDKFHENIDHDNIALLQGLSFFRMEDKRTDWNILSLINEGRAKDLDPVVYSKHMAYNDTLEAGISGHGTEMFIESNLYISCNGDVKTCCDTAYDNDAYTIGNLYAESLEDILIRECTAETDIA